MKTQNINYSDITSEVIIPKKFIDRILIPYRKECHYLKRAKIIFESKNNETVAKFTGDFEIDRSCYIDDTGHFNAVEFNICYNQLAYASFGYCIQEGMMPELVHFKGDRFFKEQLSNFLIARINSSYSSEIDAKDFQGELGLQKAITRNGNVFLYTYCNFRDSERVKSKGEVLLVCTNS